jgi:hypothetical protein
MVRFEKNNNELKICGTDAVVTIEQCGVDEYFYIVNSLLNVLAGLDKDFFDKDDLYNYCWLLRSMLPGEEQIKTE